MVVSPLYCLPRLSCRGFPGDEGPVFRSPRPPVRTTEAVRYTTNPGTSRTKTLRRRRGSTHTPCPSSECLSEHPPSSLLVGVVTRRSLAGGRKEAHTGRTSSVLPVPSLRRGTARGCRTGRILSSPSGARSDIRKRESQGGGLSGGVTKSSTGFGGPRWRQRGRRAAEISVASEGPSRKGPVIPVVRPDTRRVSVSVSFACRGADGVVPVAPHMKPKSFDLLPLLGVDAPGVLPVSHQTLTPWCRNGE